MSKAIFMCDECKKEETVSFNVGEKPNAPVCENCKKKMKRKFKVGKGSIIPDDIMYVSRMMSYQSSKK